MGFKWFNDVLVWGGKLVGILVEVVQLFVVFGVGFNVIQVFEEVDFDVILLLDFGVVVLDCNCIVSRLLCEFEVWIIQWCNVNL